MNEHSLHSEVKTKYSLPGDQFEVKLDNYIADILRGDLVIEVQTKNFSALKEKLQVLIQKHKVRLVYPMPERKWITYVTEDNVTLRKRKSSRKGMLSDVFRELVMIANLIGNENFSFEVLFIDEEEIRCADGKGSWKRRGVSVKERRLLKVNKQVLFRDKADYLKVLPDNLNEDFTNNELAKSAGLSLRTARQITYCLRKCGALQIVEKKGRAFVFQRLAGS